MSGLLNLTIVPCDVCCSIIQNRDSVSGFYLSYNAIATSAMIVLALIVLFTGIFLLVKAQLFQIYLAFLLLTSFSLTLELVEQIMPPVLLKHSYYWYSTKVLYASTIYLEWLIQTGATFFLWQEDPEKNLKKVLIASLVLSTSLFVPWIIAIFLDHEGNSLKTPFVRPIAKVFFWT